jgi:hypothetical protein
MVRQATLPKSSLAITAAVHFRNWVTCRGTRGVPYELLTGLRADLSSMRLFRCPAYAHVDKYQRCKLDNRVWEGVFAAYAPESPAWLVFNHATP